jgi:hypothetical protein
LKFNVIFNSEEIIPGRKATFIFPIDLLLNENKISITQLKNVNIEFVFIQDNGVSQKRNFTN